MPKHGDTPTEVAKNQFILHIRTYVVADKYMAGNLAEFALQNVDNIVKTQIDNNSLEFYRFAVKIVYEGENIFENEEEATEEETTDEPEEGESDMVGNREVTANYQEKRGYKGDGLEQFPLERIKAILVAEALYIWLRAERSFNRYDVARIVREVPLFGTDIAVTALESPEI